MARAGHIWLLALLSVFYLVNGVSYLRKQSVNADEGSFSEYAVRYMKGDPDRVDPRSDNSKMPVIALNMIPRAVQVVLHPEIRKQDFGAGDIIWGRYVSLFISLFILLLVYRWGSLLYGSHAGIFSAFLYCFCPNGMANNVFVSTDMYSVLMLLVTMFFFWKWSYSGITRHFIFLAVSVALSQLVKQSLFHLYVLLPLLVFVGRRMGKLPVISWRMMVVFLLVQLLVINVGYYFHRSFIPLGDYHFMSALFIQMQQLLPDILPVPFPAPFVEGLDMAKYYDQIGGGMDGVSSFGKVTILGRESTGGSFWYYYLVTLFFKTPIAIMVMFFLAIWKMNGRWRWDEFLLLAPVVYFLVIFSLFYKTQVGIRHMVIIFPFVFLICASLLRGRPGARLRYFLAASSIYLVISVGYYWGNYFPYTNEFIRDKKDAWKYVGSANLELNQGYQFARAYLSAHPDVSLFTARPHTGIYLVTTAAYLNTWNRPEYAWVREGEVVGQVAFNWLLVRYEKPSSVTND